MKYYIPRFNLSKLKGLITKLSKKTKVEFSYDEKDIKLDDIVIDTIDLKVLCAQQKAVQYKQQCKGFL